MNRTAHAVLVCLCTGSLALLAQEPGKPAAAQSQGQELDQLVAAMQQAEAGLKTASLAMTTTGTYPGDLQFTTKGTLRVLLGAQPCLHTVMEFEFTSGMRGRLETVRTPEGAWMLEESPTYGQVFLSMDRATLEDIEWAAAVTKQGAMVPGGEASQARTPLGSQLLTGLRRSYDLKLLAKKDRDGQAGIWIGGDKRQGLDPGLESELLLADHVEVFVRTPDQAVTAVFYLQADGKVVQRILVDKLVVDEPMTAASFKLEVAGKKPKDVREHLPAWAPLDKLLGEAESKCKAEAEAKGRQAQAEVRPSRRQR